MTNYPPPPDRKSTRLNSSHTEIYTLSLHDALPISMEIAALISAPLRGPALAADPVGGLQAAYDQLSATARSEEHTSELQSHRDLHSFPTRRSSDLDGNRRPDFRAAARTRTGGRSGWRLAGGL